MAELEKWNGRVAVVTGATGGIGAAIAKDLVKMGMHVVGLARRKDKVEALRASLFGLPGQLCAVECDITNEAAVKQAYAWIDKILGPVHLIVNNAGVVSNAMLLDDGNTKDLRKIMETNIIGLCLCTREAVKSMKAHDITDGHIININSIFGHKVNTCVPGNRPLNGMYPASKHAVTAITECIRQELIYLNTNVKVTSISPGLVENDILTTGTKDDMVRLMPLLKPEDVSKAVIYAITAAEHVLIQEIILKPMGEFL